MITRILHATEELVPGKPAVEAKKAVIVDGVETVPAVKAAPATEDELVVTSASIQTFDEKGAEKCCEELDPKQFAGIFAASAKAAEKTAAEAEKAAAATLKAEAKADEKAAKEEAKK